MRIHGLSIFYAPEAHIMYLTVSSSFLISFGKGGGAARVGRLSSFMHLSGLNRVIKFLYAPAPPPPTVWALKHPSCALMHKTTYALMIYTALCMMFWMRVYPLLGQVGGGWALEISSFLGPKWHLPISSMPFYRAKESRFPGPNPLPLALIMDMHASKTLCTGLCTS